MPLDTSLSMYLLMSVLGCVLTIAVWHDIRTYRVPNYVVVTGTALALLLHGFSDRINSLAHATQSSLGISGAVFGFAVGFILFLPFYLIRAAGAGDVKLMATVGAFLGPLDMFATYLWTCAVGAVMAVLLALKRGVAGRMLKNIRRILRSILPGSTTANRLAFDPSAGTAAKLPYSLAIAAGTIVWMAVRLSH